MIKAGDLSLLPLCESDKDFYFQIYSNKSLMQYITKPLTREAADKSFYLTLMRMSQSPPKIKLNVIFLDKTKEKIGVIGLRWNQGSSRIVELGTIILEEHQGTGLAHLAKKTLIQEAFTNLNINKIVSNCEKRNHSAIKSNKKLGFKRVKEYVEIKSQVTQIKWEIVNE